MVRPRAGDGDDQVMVEGSTLRGRFSAQLESGRDRLQALRTTFHNAFQALTGADDDIVDLRNVSARGLTQVQTGEGRDRILLMDSVFAQLQLRDGPGADTTQLRRTRIVRRIP